MPPDLQRAGPQPIYKQIVDWMRQQITSGDWPEHYKLPSEIDLAAELQVSRGTLRKAILELTADGLLLQIHGRGTFVSSERLEQPLAERLLTFSDDLIQRNIPFETRVIEQTVIVPPPRVASLLALPPGARALCLKRLRIVAGTTYVLLHNYVAYDRCPGIETVDFAQARLFETLEKRYRLELDWGSRYFEAQSANNELAALLHIQPCDPVMYMQQIAYLREGAPIEMSDMWVGGSYFRLSVTVKRSKSGGLTGDIYDYVSPRGWETSRQG
ncbi:MAG: GntR family transcriptional regulator [Chloroflexi bacterium]|nr:GntR family transcriptional regulator [Chloroflexota bacterium]